MCLRGFLIHENIPPVTVSSFQPCPKRARQETSAEEEYSRYLQTAEGALKAIQALAEGKTNPAAAPQWLQSRLQELQNIIDHISKARHKS